MILDKNNSCIIIKKSSEKKFNRIAFAINQLFSKFLYKPKIIFNTCSNFLALAQLLKNNAKVKVVKHFPLGIFSYITHFEGYDLGIYCYENNNKKIIKFFSGSGFVLSDVLFSILENYLIGNKQEEFKKSLHKIKKINIKILNFNEIIKNEKNYQYKKLVKNYINHYKNKMVLKQICGKISHNEKLLINRVFKFDNNADLSVFISENNVYFYNNNKIIDINQIINFKTILIDSFNEYQMFKQCYESKKEVLKLDNKLYVTRNCFTFEIVSFISYFCNILKDNF